MGRVKKGSSALTLPSTDKAKIKMLLSGDNWPFMVGKPGRTRSGSKYHFPLL